jgi:hypothetical protein
VPHAIAHARVRSWETTSRAAAFLGVARLTSIGRMTKLTSMIAITALCLGACSSDDDANGNDAGDPPGDVDAGGGAGTSPGTDAAVDAGGGSGGSGAPEDGGGPSMLPAKLLLEGTAEIEQGDDRVECRFFGELTDLVEMPTGAIDGLFIGELFRTTHTGGGSFEFAPLVGGSASITPIAGNQIELRFVGDQPDDALDFWLELEVVIGDDQGDFHYGGDWTCAPGLLGDPGFMDIDLSAPGSWTLVPEG